MQLPHVSVSQAEILDSKNESYLCDLRHASCPQESHSSFCSLFTSSLAMAANLFLSAATGPDGCCTFWRQFFVIDFLAPCFYRQLKLKQDIWTRSNYYYSFYFRITWKSYIKIVAQY